MEEDQVLLAHSTKEVIRGSTLADIPQEELWIELNYKQTAIIISQKRILLGKKYSRERNYMEID